MNDTIAAVSTAYGEGGIGIIRISGDDARAILGKIFTSAENVRPRHLTYGHIIDPSTNKIIDEVLACFMPAPATYTTEDVVEIDCHGSIVSLQQILSLCIRMGARPAERGEFTKRAFLGGRLDLSQAEAVIDIVRAKTDMQYGAAQRQLEGSLGNEVRDLRRRLLDVLVNVTVNIDYPDEDIEEVIYQDMIVEISSVKEGIDNLLASTGTGRIIKEGLAVSIIGKPNVGKSSLMNALLKESRAIVTDIPGTTRDTIEESINIDGIPVVLTDTAGIRDANDEIERIGISRSRDSALAADLIIFILDVTRDIDDEDQKIARQIKDKKTIILMNKCDMLGAEIVKESKVPAQIAGIMKDPLMIKTSFVTGEGIDTLRSAIYDLVMGGHAVQQNSLIVTNARHEALLSDAASALADAIDIAISGEALEIIEIDISRAYQALGEIIGEEIADDIINEVFERFCLGK